VTFRQRLLLVFSILVISLVASFAWIVSRRADATFNTMAGQQAAAVASAFHRRLTRREAAVAAVLGRMATDPALRQIAHGTGATVSPAAFVTVAASFARQYHLDYLELVSPGGTILSSAQWPARYGYQEPAISESGKSPFLAQEQLPSGSSALGIFAVRALAVSGPPLYLVGGRRLDPRILRRLPVPAGTKLALYSNTSPGFDPRNFTASGRLPVSRQYAPIVNQARALRRPASGTVSPSHDTRASLSVTALPLTGPGGSVVALLIVATSRLPLIRLDAFIRNIAFAVALAGVLLTILAGLWIARSLSQTLLHVERTVAQVADGNWDARLAIPAGLGFSSLARGFNRMIRELSTQHHRLVQTERIVAWQEFARHLAREVSQPLAPIQRTLEELMRARRLPYLQFNAVFDASIVTLQTELRRLRAISGRFSDFSLAPQPRLETMDIRDTLHAVVSASMPTLEQRRIEIGTSITSEPLPILGDPDMLFSALASLILRAAESTRGNSVLTVSAAHVEERARISIACTHCSLLQDAGSHQFAILPTGERQEENLSLAAVQAIFSGHRGDLVTENSGADQAETLRWVIVVPLANMLLTAPKTGV
jgi:hypothetical protein